MAGDKRERLVIEASRLGEIFEHARSTYPMECCGLLGGRGEMIERVLAVENADPSAASYHMDSREQFRAMKELEREGLDMSAIYHSHPMSPPEPSPRDIALAFFSETLYLIVGMTEPEEPEPRLWRIEEGGRVEEVPLVVV